MDLFIPEHLKTNYQECLNIASSHYENFPVASLLLPAKIRVHIAALYAFARTADDFADEPQYEGQRIQKINRWEKDLQIALKFQKASPILQAFAHTLKTFHIPLQLPLDLLKAYRMDLTHKGYPTWNKLLYYCKHSANPVGRMVLYISGVRDEPLHRYSDFICTSLQLINFWQDTMIDLGRNRIYYPQTELKKVGLRKQDLLALKDSPAVRVLVQNAINYTEDYLQKGHPLLNQVSGRLQLELRATYLGGQAILNKIRKTHYNVLKTRPVLTPFNKISLVVRTLCGQISS